MGLLEDAIREHLDLKRKHGAPEQELERQEVEALGPARRELAPEDAEAGEAPVEGDATPDDAAAAAAPDEAAFAEPEPEVPLEVPFGEEPDVGAEPDAAVGPEPLVEQDPFTEAEADVEPEPQAVEPELPPDPPLEPDPAAAHDLPPDPEASSTVDQPTEFFDVEEAIRAEDAGRSGDTPARGFPAQQPDEDELEDEAAAAPAAEGDDDADVLEDTPDFLQDAPEHDRLWFEQKPPRDFDFD